MGYQEEKDKYDLIFHRELSDREFAEAMYEKWAEWSREGFYEGN